MKRTKGLLIAICSLTLLLACSSSPSDRVINLKNGEKWKVNTEMKPHIEKGNELLNEFVSTQGVDYHQLAEDLKAQNNALIQSCTMEGESHDELHKWLHPHIQLVEKLSDANNSEQAEVIVNELEKSFDTYEKYFN